MPIKPAELGLTLYPVPTGVPKRHTEELRLRTSPQERGQLVPSAKASSRLRSTPS